MASTHPLVLSQASIHCFKLDTDLLPISPPEWSTPHSTWKVRPDAAVYVCPLLAGHDSDAVGLAPAAVEVLVANVDVALELLNPLLVRDDVGPAAVEEVEEEELTLRVETWVFWGAAGWVLGWELRSMLRGPP